MMLSPSAPPAGREKGGRPACPVGGRLLPDEVGERDVERAGDEQQVHKLDAAAHLDALDRRATNLHALGERLLRQVGVLAGLSDTDALLLAGEADPLALVVGHPSKLMPG